jgi:hypothetical protein
LKTLDSNEQNQLTAGVMTDKAREKYRQYFYNRDRVQQLQGDLSVITQPPVIPAASKSLMSSPAEMHAVYVTVIPEICGMRQTLSAATGILFSLIVTGMGSLLRHGN